MGNATEFKQARTLKQNLQEILFSLQYLKVDGVSLTTKLKIDGQIKLSKEGDLEKEAVTNLRTALALSEAVKSMTDTIKTPRNNGVLGALHMADKNKGNK